MFKNANLNKWNILLISLLAVSIYGFLAFKLKDIRFNRQEASILIQSPYMLLFILLWIIQFFIEAVKWKVLVSTNQKFSLVQSLKSIFIGYAVSVLTPGRIGEWFGRSATVKKERLGITYLATAGSLLQTLTIFLFAIPSAILYYDKLPSHLLKTDKYLSIVIGGLAFLFALVLLLRFFHRRLKAEAFKQLKVFTNIKKRIVITISILTAIRYLVFTAQFGVLLFIISEVNFVALIGIIPLYYLFITLFPVVTFLEPGIRLTAAFILFEPVGLTTNILTIAVLFIWLFNLITPALIGSTLVYKLKILRAR